MTDPIDCPFCREKESEIARLKNELKFARRSIEMLATTGISVLLNAVDSKDEDDDARS